MAKRFGDIQRGGELKIGLDNYVKYQNTKEGTFRVDGTGEYNARPTADVEVTPFYRTLQADGDAEEAYFVPQSTKAIEPANFAKTVIDNYQKTLGTAKAGIRPKGYRPARAIVTQKAAGVPTKERSKFTKLYYRKYNVSSYSMPFGRKDAKSEFDTRKEIIGALDTQLKEPGRNISFREEADPGA